MIINTFLKVTGIPPSLNVMLNMHWGKRNSLKKEWHQKIQFEIAQLGLTRIEKKDIIVAITYYFKTKAGHDFDNYSGKFVMDSLKNNLIIDDSQKYIKELRIRFGLAGIGVEPYTTIELSYDNEQPDIVKEITNKSMDKKLTLKKLDKAIEQSECTTRCSICGRLSPNLIKGIDQVTNKIIMFCAKCMMG